MRPSILFPLFADIRTLSGVGPKLEKLIAKVAGPRLVDLVFDLPVGVVDRSYRPKLIAAEAGPHRHRGSERAGPSAATGQKPALQSAGVGRHAR